MIDSQDAAIKEAVKAIHNYDCVVFPTETVYGLGADATSEEATMKIFKLKNRPPTNPLIVHVPDIEGIFSVAASINPIEEILIHHFCPGPLTLVLPKKHTISSLATADYGTVGVRIPNHEVALEFLRQVQRPICAPSANISGRPSPTTLEMAQHYMKDKVPVILDGGTLDIGIESTVIKVEKNKIYILRAGFITAEMIYEKTGIKPIENITKAHLSPGTNFTHYKPKANVIAFHQGEKPMPEASEPSAILYLSPTLRVSDFQMKYGFSSTKDYAQALYHTFFECDKQGITNIYCELPEAYQHGAALRDRILRAACNK